MKKRILFCNEATFLSTGFSTYGLEVMNRLHATGKYELAEYASYGPIGDPRENETPWKYFSCAPTRPELDLYNSKPTNQFGEWKFEQTCLSFLPDIVVDIRDWWMLEYQQRSPFRPYFKWAIMPTVDSAPQDEQWLATYMSADAVFAYSDWGLDVLKQEGGGLVKTRSSAPPGADFDTYSPIADKKSHREKMGLPGDCRIIGTVMRNQKRKLFPDLIESFAKLLATGPAELTQKTYLYLHTSYPDLGWDIPRLIKESGVGHRTLFTYMCQQCGACFPNFFSDAKAVCRRCGQASALLPNSFAAVSRKTLAEVINLFDAYVQYAICEGFGMPQVDAAACGVPVFAVDYSAMCDVVRKLNGFPIKVQRLFRESETHCYRAYPDNDDLVRQLVDFLLLPDPIRARRGFEARQAVEQHYTWDKTAKVWENYFDSQEVIPHEQTWNAPPRYHKPATQEPQGLSTEEWVRWGIQHVAGRPDLLSSYLSLRLARDLNWGSSTGGTGGQYFNENATLGQGSRLRRFGRKEAMEELTRICEYRNLWEKRRTERGS